MLQPDGQIADWVGLPYQGKTLLEGINVVFVDSTATSARLSARNLNVWMRRAAFGAWPFSSTGYQGIIGDTAYSQEPTGANEAYRDAFFLLTNSHGRAFGPYPNPSGPGYVWIGAWSKENLDTANLTHGHESFDEARDALPTAMVDKGATNLGYIDMANTYNTADFSTRDSDGMAIVLGLDLPIGVSRAYRGAPPRSAGKRTGLLLHGLVLRFGHFGHAEVGVLVPIGIGASLGRRHQLALGAVPVDGRPAAPRRGDLHAGGRGDGASPHRERGRNGRRDHYPFAAHTSDCNEPRLRSDCTAEEFTANQHLPPVLSQTPAAGS